MVSASLINKYSSFNLSINVVMASELSLFLSLINNLSVFVVLIAGYGFLTVYLNKFDSRTRQIILGIFFGLIAIASMHVKIPATEGVIVDQRNAIVALSGAFGGPLSALFSVILTASYRTYLGGSGALAGSVGVCLAASSGLLLYRFRSFVDSFYKWVIAVFIMTLIILPGFLLVGDLQNGWELLKRVAFPFGAAIFIGIFFGGLLLGREDKRHLTEVKVLDSAKRLMAHLHNTPLGVIEWDIDFKVAEWNPAAEKIFGYSRQQALGEHAFDLIVSAGTRGEVDEVWGQLLKQKGGVQNINENLTQDGTVKTCEWYNTVLTDAGGEVVGVASLVMDITERKQANDELRVLRNYLSNVINSMPSTLVGVDVEGNVTEWNNTAEQTTGITAQLAHGKPLAELLPWMKEEIKTITESIRSRQVMRDQNKARQLGDKICYEDVTIYPLVTNGVEGAVIRIDDVTEKVNLEEMMVQSEKMLSVGGLAAGMAHEINNPLAGMMQTANVMSNRLDSQLNIEANQKAAEAAGTNIQAIHDYMAARGIIRMIDTINESGKRVAGIVDNMLSFSRKSDSTVLSQNLAELLDKTLELAATDYDLKKQFDFKLIGIIKEYEDDFLEVPCEGAKIQQVLLNILRNGAQAMQQAGIKHPQFIIRYYLDKSGDKVCLEIEDNGPGMDEKIRKRIFEPFFTTKSIGEGTGLGLSVSYFIITENHRGQMSVESFPGGGAKFIICLPILNE